MLNSFQAFHHSIIDYAGLFPPASLNLEQAVSDYLNYLSHEDQWMLGAFILPANKISALSNLLKSIPTSNPIPISLISSDLEKDIHEFHKFASDTDHEIHLSSIEIKEEHFKLHPSKNITYIEPTDLNNLTDILNIAQVNNLGIKLRCGGVKPSMIPSSLTVASVIENCTSRAIPMKFTAGLHHPFRHHSDAHSTMLHGFINIFAATILSRKQQLNHSQINEILEDQCSKSFIFNEHGLTWNNLNISTEDIENLRQTQAHSYGSCSFTEPRQDLTDLGWM